MRRLISIIAALGASAGAGACAIGDGHGFTTIEAATLGAVLEPGPARELGDRTVLTDLGFRVQVERAQLQIEGVDLQSLRGGGGGGVFDPADPPPGYTFCHSGHCHAEDGRLVPYEEVQRDLAGGTGTSYQTIVHFHLDHTFDLWAGEAVAAEEIEPSPELGRIDLARATMTVLRLSLSGTAGREGFSAPLSVELELEGALRATLTETIDRSSPEHVRVSVTARPDGTLFDGIDFESGDSFEEQLAANMLSSTLEVEWQGD